MNTHQPQTSHASTAPAPWKRRAARTMLAFYLFQTILAVLPAQAGNLPLAPATSAPAGQRPLIDAAQNGVPIVLVAPPSAGGVSRNQFSQFNVNQNGLILNNSGGNSQTQLGGWISGNPQLGSTPARIILNEVVSNNPSQLRGAIEVAGQRANIVIANPNGIVCDGCSFLNTGRGTLSTGQPQFGAGGALTGFNVNQGQLSIGSGGLNARNIEQLDLIARGLVFEGEVWANNLQVLAGANQVLYGTLQATPQAGAGAAPRFAIDIKDLGGMYANQVYMTSTEQGLGVNSTGRVAALQGNLILSANGDLTLKDSYAKQNIQLAAAGNTTLTGQTQSGGSTRITTAANLAQQGTLDSQGQVTLNAASIANSGMLLQRSADSMALTASANSSNSGTISSGGALILTATDLNDTNGKLLAAGDLSLQAQSQILSGTQISADQNIHLHASAGNLQAANTRIAAGGNLDASASGQLNNSNGIWQAAQNVTLQGASIANAGSSVLAAKGQLALTTAGTVDNSGGKLMGSSAVVLNAGQLLNDNGLIASDLATRITSAQAINNQSGTLSGKTGLSVNANGAALNNSGGTIVSDAALDLSAGALDNRRGQIIAGGSLTLNASAAIDNTQGSISSGNSAGTPAGNTVIQSGSLINNGGQVIARDALAVTTGTLNNDAIGASKGVLSSSAASVTVNAGATSNAGGLITSASGTSVTSQALNNRAGEISSGAALTLDTSGQTLNNSGGRLLANGNLTIQSGAMTSNVDGAQAATVSSGQDLSIRAASLNNDGSSIVAFNANPNAGNVRLELGSGSLSSQAGAIQASNGITLNVGSVANQRGRIAANNTLAIHAASIDNSDGALSAANAVTLTSTGTAQNLRGQIVSNGNINLSASTLDNSAGTISAKQQTSLQLANGLGLLNNAGGQIIGSQALSVQSGEIRNAAGSIASGSGLTLDTHGQALNNSHAGKIVANGTLAINSAQLDNSGGTMASLTANTSVATGNQKLTNDNGKIQAAGNTTISAGDTSNQQGTISGQDLSLTTAALNNRSGQIVAAGNLTAATGALDNTQGLLQSVGNASIDSHGLSIANSNSGSSGGIVAGGSLDIKAGAINNQAGYIASNGQQTLHAAGDLDNRALNTVGGQIVGNLNSTITAANILNSGGLVQTLGDLDLSASSTLDNRGGRISANGDTTLTASNLDNRQLGASGGNISAKNIRATADTVNNAGGSIKAGRDVTVTVTRGAASLDNSSGVLSAKQGLTVNATSLNNAGGQIVGDNSATITTSSNTLGGTIASGKQVTLNVNGDYNNTGLLSSQQNLTINANNINNSGTLTAGDTLTANTGNLNNTGEISAKTTNLNLSGTLTNSGSGLIDGINTTIRAGTINNSGRIYGDLLAIGGGTLNNFGPGVIAARNTLLIGVQNLNNTEGGLIYSLKDMGLGGSLSANGQLQGSMQNFLNASARIEAQGDLSLNAVNIVNRDNHLRTKLVTDPTINQDQIQPKDSTTKYPASQCIGVGGGQDEVGCMVHPDKYGQRSNVPSARTKMPEICSGGGDSQTCQPGYTIVNYQWNDPVFSRFGVTPVASAFPVEPNGPGSCSTYDGNSGSTVPIDSAACKQWRSDYAAWDVGYQAALDQLETKLSSYNTAVTEDNRLDKFEDYLWYKVAATSSHTEVVSSAPAQILAGGNITLTGSTLNQDSQIVAGGVNRIIGPDVINRATQGVNSTSYSGTVQFTHVESCGTLGNRHCREWDAINNYDKAPEVISVDLPTVRYQQYANQTASRDLTVATSNPDGTTAGAVSAASGNSRTVKVQAVDAVLAAGPAASNIAATLPLIQTVQAHGSGAHARDLILTSAPRLTVPNSSLFVIHAEPGARYLVETDPRFTSQRTFLSSDYFLQSLNRDPSRNLKRYGDGFYEQQLINDQILALTGRRYLSGYASTEQEYQALMNAGVAFARQYQLSPGVALSAEQMANLTTDIVWLAPQTVTLADGSRQQVLVPQVYLRRAQDGDLQRSGALIAGSDVLIQTEHDLVNSGSIAADHSTALDAGHDLLNQGGRISGQDIVARARNDLTNLSGVIQGTGIDSTVALLAGRDIVLQTRTIATANAQGTSTRTNIDRLATVQGGSVRLDAMRDLIAQGAQVSATGSASEANPSGGNLIATAGRDIKVSAVAGHYQIAVNQVGVDDGQANRVEGRSTHIKESNTTHQLAGFNAINDLALVAGQGDVNLSGANLSAGRNAVIAGNNVTIAAVKDSVASDVQTVGKKDYYRNASSDEALAGGNVSANNNLTVKASGAAGNGDNANKTADASGNITLTGAYLSTQTGQIALAAKHDITIQNASTEHSAVQESFVKTGDALSTKSTTISNRSTLQQAEASTVSGDSVSLVAGHDLTVQGSNVVGGKDVSLTAGHDVKIATAQSTSDKLASRREEISGVYSSGGFSWGSNEQDNQNTLKTVTNTGSVLGATGGNLSISAGERYSQTGSRVVAPAGNIDIAAKTVEINSAFDSALQINRTHTESSGLSLGVSSPIITAAQSIEAMQNAAKKTDDPRMKLLALVLAIKAAADVAQAAANPEVTVSLTVGSSRSDSENTQRNSTAVGSSVAAGNSLKILATGGGKDSNLSVFGSDLSAGKDASLKADGNINLQAAQSTSDQKSSNSSSSAAVGIAATFGSNGMSFGITANAAGSRGKADGSDVTQSNTHVTAGNTLTLASGADTNIKGGVVSGNTVKADVGGNLNIESLQDTSKYQSKDQSIGGSVTVGYGFAASGNFNTSKVNGDFASVGEQSGIAAGDGGFQVKVGGNTDLKGAAIASSEQAVADNKNSLTTKTLTQSEVQNHSDFHASGLGLSGGFSVSGSGDKKGGGSKAADGSSQSADGQQAENKGPSIKTFQDEKQGTAAGYGSRSGSSSSTTTSGISGGVIAITDDAAQQAKTGSTAEQTVASIKRDISTGKDNSNAIVKDWDGQKLNDDVKAQVQITAAFGQLAAKEIGKYATDKEDVLRRQARQSSDNGDKDGAAALNAEADKWAEGGVYRVALHTATGALTGGLQGAAGALTSTTTMATVGAAIDDMDLPKGIKQGLAQVTATVLGGIVGGGAGAAAGLNVEANNRQLHQGDKATAKELAKKGPYTEQEILDALRRSGLKDQNGKVIVAADMQETYVNGKALNPTSADLSMQDNQRQNAPVALDCYGQSGTACIERLPTAPTKDLMNFIVDQTGGKSSRYFFNGSTQAQTSNGNGLPAAPQGTHRISTVVDGKAYFPLAATCPAAGCTNGDPIAYAIDDPGTKAYQDALAHQQERDFNIFSGVFGGVGRLAGAVKAIAGLSEAGAVVNNVAREGTLIRNSDSLLEAEIKSTPLDAQQRLNSPDIGGSGKVKPAESAVAAQLESSLGQMERYSPSAGMTGKSPDFVITSGPNAGKTVDAMYTTDNLTQKEIEGLNKYYAKNMEAGSGQKVIQDHLSKADFVPVDFRVLAPENQKIFLDYVKTLPRSQQNKIIIVR
ncbi:hemagglutinin repeat-containing protein [Paraherbaspirillum soli]|uniref:Hemagglutinin repeat-containing protein n=1 Tax=Paraherbaspirillum soli TaxID=631222 RepID=A0ABW0M5V9_9BURK